MAAQNRPRWSRSATGGRPGDGNGARPDRSDLRFRLSIATASVKVLRRPLESAGFYSAFMVADRVDVVSRRAGSDEAAIWSSDGQGAFTIAPIDTAEAPARGTRVILHLKEDATSYTERHTLERVVRAQSGHVPSADRSG